MIQRIIKTIETIASSPQLEQYMIGISMHPKRTFTPIEPVGFDHYITIAFRFGSHQIIELNKTIFYECVKDKNSILYKKYHHQKRDRRCYPSLGGLRAKETDEKFDLYMAWWNK